MSTLSTLSSMTKSACLLALGANLISTAAFAEALNSSNDLSIRMARELEPRLINHVKILRNNPRAGFSRHQVWDGNWWPMSKKGTNVDGAISKYDIAVRKDPTQQAARWEEADSSRSATVSWAGHCNGLAAASINVPEPKLNVRYNGVTFTPTDIKALLVEAFQNPGQSSSLIGDRCEQATTGGRYSNPACRDMNPAAFHMTLGAFLGKNRLPVIFDISGDSAVWNYPAISYNIDRIGILNSAAEAQQYVTGRAGTYTFNPSATSFALVTTTVDYVSGPKTYDYILELRPAAGDFEIIGGEWVGESKQDHPDFAWVKFMPTVENPYLDPSSIFELLRMSAPGEAF